MLCEELLEEHSWGLGVIAFDWAYRVKAQYTEDTYEIFYCWLKKYVRGWGDCDDFCTHAFGELLRRYKTLFSKVKTWTKDDDFWVRRASAVILIPLILRNDYEGIDPFIISDLLMSDKHDLVQKGYGCVHCNKCVQACPVNALESEEMNQLACWDNAFGDDEITQTWVISCHKCRDVCPYNLGVENKLI